MDFHTRQKLQKRLRDLLEPTIERLDLILSAVELTGSAAGNVVRLYIDSAEGVGIHECTRVSREVSPLLDVHDPLPGSYNLEVSSPGSDRILERREDYIRFAGFRVKVKLAPDGPRKRYGGVLLRLDGDGFWLKDDMGEHLIPLESVDTVRLHPTPEEFERLRSLYSFGQPSTEQSESAEQSESTQKGERR